jgi:signal transduction histidine kinase
MQFNAANIEAIHTEDDMQSAAFESVTKKLYEIRSALPDVEYVYLMRRSDDPHKMTFISDADLFISPNGVDENHNGVIESNEEPSLPGTPYDIADAPALINAFYGPTTDDDFTTDQWGTFISGYAPVRDNTGRVVAILGIDMNDANFLRVSHSMFTPSLLFLVLLLGLMLSLYVGVANWKRKIEMYKELEDERSSLINLAMHQLGAPLAIIRWWLEILCDSEQCSKPNACTHCDVCEQMQEGVSRLIGVMESLREISEIESVKVFSKTPTDFDACVKGISDEVAPRLHNLKMKLDTSTQQPGAMIAINQKLLMGVLRELITNAIDYSHPGGTITLSAKKIHTSLFIEIADQGFGIAKADLPSLFQKFSRGSNAVRIKPVGNGVGLFYVKRILEKAHGAIELRSKEGEGTTVIVQLPLV